MVAGVTMSKQAALGAHAYTYPRTYAQLERCTHIVALTPPYKPTCSQAPPLTHSNSSIPTDMKFQMLLDRGGVGIDGDLADALGNDALA